MTTYHSNATIEINDVAGLVWQNVDNDPISATISLVPGDKIHDMNGAPTITCSLSDIDNETDEDGNIINNNSAKVKMSFTVTGANFDDSDVMTNKVRNSTNINVDGITEGPWRIGEEIGETDNTDADTDKWDAIAHTISRAYTFSDDLTPYSNLKAVFTDGSINAFRNSILAGITGSDELGGGLTQHIYDTDVGTTVDIYVQFETDETTVPHFDYYTNSGFNQTVLDHGSPAQQFILRMVQLQNDTTSSFDLANKMSTVMNGETVDPFDVFSGDSMVFPVNVTVAEAFNHSPGKFGVRVTFA
jgi:hypothetical protein